MRWRAHWLAVEGVQPLIKENPISQIQEPDTAHVAAAPATSAPHASHGAARKRKLQASVAAAKTHLSQELLLFFTRITEALIPNPAAAAAMRPSADAAAGAGSTEVELSDAEQGRLAALATLAADPSLSDLLPYLVRWLSEMIMVSISGGTEGRTTAELGYLLDGMQALITNPALFIEPYVSPSSSPDSQSRPSTHPGSCSYIKCCRPSCPSCSPSRSATRPRSRHRRRRRMRCVPRRATCLAR